MTLEDHFRAIVLTQIDLNQSEMRLYKEKFITARDIFAKDVRRKKRLHKNAVKAFNDACEAQGVGLAHFRITYHSDPIKKADENA